MLGSRVGTLLSSSLARLVPARDGLPLMIWSEFILCEDNDNDGDDSGEDGVHFELS